ncbi:hypothetical protein [Palaeococcus sp. (in: euryarchaeotes)]
MRTRCFVGFLPLFALLLYFELGYLMEYDTGECPLFGTVVYNVPCRLFSLVMLFIGLSVISLLLAGKIRTSLLSVVSYFIITFFAAWEWALSARVISLVGIILSLVSLYISPREVETSKSLCEAISLVIYAFVFLVFLLSAVSYALYFSWICKEAYSGTTAVLCSVISYAVIMLGMVSPVLWVKGRRNWAAVILLTNFLFFGVVLRLPMGGWTELAIAFSVVVVIIELLDAWHGKHR